MGTLARSGLKINTKLRYPLLPYFTQPVFTRLKLAIETLEQGVKYIQSKQVNNKDTRTTTWRRSGVLIIELNIFHTLF